MIDSSSSHNDQHDILLTPTVALPLRTPLITPTRKKTGRELVWQRGIQTVKKVLSRRKRAAVPIDFEDDACASHSGSSSSHSLFLFEECSSVGSQHEEEDQPIRQQLEFQLNEIASPAAALPTILSCSESNEERSKMTRHALALCTMMLSLLQSLYSPLFFQP